MEPHKIEDLLEKYLAGNTDLNEENTLRNYFTNGENIPENLQEFKVLFSFFKSERKKTAQEEVLLPKPRSYKWLISAASFAAVIIILLMVQPFSPKQNNTGGNSQMATENTKGLFMIMGGAVKESRVQLSYLNELNTTKNQIISKKTSK